MRIMQVTLSGVLSEMTRRRLERLFFSDIDSAFVAVQLLFPNHVVTKMENSLIVSNRDRQITVAVFKQAPSRPLDGIKSDLGCDGPEKWN